MFQKNGNFVDTGLIVSYAVANFPLFYESRLADHLHDMVRFITIIYHGVFCRELVYIIEAI